MIAISDVFCGKERFLGYDRRRKATRQVALGNASSAAGHHKQSRIGLLILVDGHHNLVTTQF